MGPLIVLLQPCSAHTTLPALPQNLSAAVAGARSIIFPPLLPGGARTKGVGEACLNNFYARFETNDSRTAVAPEAGENGREERALTLSEHDVRRVLKQVNIRKAAGPDATFDSNTIVKFADDTAVIGLITNNDERAYLEEAFMRACTERGASPDEVLSRWELAFRAWEENRSCPRANLSRGLASRPEVQAPVPISQVYAARRPVKRGEGVALMLSVLRHRPDQIWARAAPEDQGKA
ncbi:hypothetical protein SKAU_G00272850 [Synaphobranchus kaupii]|uniref:Uncharacterized protein n=1 Tax=Synaphobranchus kaupii TaxID=118154 RepID=A0A9Q1F0P8_SYNKA|nr:hypothetical protein SKAU_G00272850 [Synaphobranchus kaupii]